MPSPVLSRRLALAALSFAGVPLAARADTAHGAHAKGHGAQPKKTQMPWGIVGDAKAATRTVVLRMTDDMRFTPDKLAISQGETIRIVLHNHGKLQHELVLGTRRTLDAHAAMMVKSPGMAHAEPYMAHVSPGKSGEIVWHFNRPGSFEFACLIAGHYQAGMVGKIDVAAA
jgi:uncharacterized cupredoxin-like copper-binding protein